MTTAPPDSVWAIHDASKLRASLGHKGVALINGGNVNVPEMSTRLARLRAAQAQQAELMDREKEPTVTRAHGSSGCPRCTHTIAVNDLIATWPDGEGWVHFSCAVCLGCGEWLRSPGAHVHDANEH
jgi:hypothetical protein